MSFFRDVRHGMELFGSNVAMLVNSILLTLVYIIGAGLTSLVAKLSGKRFLNLSTKKEKSYWVALGKKKEPIENYYKQY
jgi:hypothetical protein